MGKINLNPNCISKPLTYQEQVRYFKSQLKRGTYNPEEEFLIVNKNNEILHGEALFEASKQLNKGVFFMLAENEHVDFIIQYSKVFSGLMEYENYISPGELKRELYPNA